MIPFKVHDYGLPVFYEIELINGTKKKARFDRIKNVWKTQGENMKIKPENVKSFKVFGQDD